MKYKSEVYPVHVDFSTTVNASSKIHPRDVVVALGRYLNKYWGDVSLEVKQTNDEAAKHGGRVFFVYHDQNNVEFWIITEIGRSGPIVLLLQDSEFANL